MLDRCAHLLPSPFALCPRYASLQRILFVYAKLNPGVRYVQGMNELVGALFFVIAGQSPVPTPPERPSDETASDGPPDDAPTAVSAAVSAAVSDAPAAVSASVPDASGDGDGGGGGGGGVGTASEAPVVDTSSEGIRKGVSEDALPEELPEELPEALPEALPVPTEAEVAGLFGEGDAAEADAFVCFTALMGELRDV